MRDLFSRTGTAALIAGLALAVAGCGGDTEAVNEPEANLVDNMMLEEPANDASVLESTADLTEPAPITNTVNETDAEETNMLGESSGGDTGGNTVESNVSGM
ncbi:hypothetical protein [Sphingosinicella sp. CPCC 101087]|uniref:hypothetical protein n=1 Tax=Sphingosinicella sp. CPCC 101087 TaxID=2497754 RepID=UPI00101DAEA3|nr:hypothetical protein [Sphingosinicella sp. CPCC 101087]